MKTGTNSTIAVIKTKNDIGMHGNLWHHSIGNNKLKIQKWKYECIHNAIFNHVNAKTYEVLNKMHRSIDRYGLSIYQHKQSFKLEYFDKNGIIDTPTTIYYWKLFEFSEYLYQVFEFVCLIYFFFFALFCE